MGSRTGWGGWLTGLAIVGSVAVSTGAWAQGTTQEREACQPDVLRLCSRFIPDVDGIVSCLHNSEPQLSPACHEVMFPRQPDPPPKPRRKSKHKRVKT
ncbi:hypothetical protein JQ557_14755 [Bradyrhizobium sp. U87765 SZCCT0131]|uniref:hypothetical protein n=1 Tax=unclassified Bradyrhizobium TaxID=2631580 RepID=UPI001BA5E508|nr:MULTISPECIES: hypothetical protein [unclassified Bradyrhizobium]MBR1219261.1 hypothetical protein [Bradyrhizobium sp. U87765 SZCCT0131]MBR1261912.1 hypothetical protein [Bradyrhizobium sp. U87765 SZCCT0134]MBR1306235.1 hypothetical protein [Bradyrhizobium sp. U87765 SZCCT0110]MBR1317694.1 hypothetical protein [Bradyrhizobium sp. U87765 SZCCT0109]MBR1351396.1 hypothetical protein [Bradyrhizobium sp. U87765 SZCCT0048]